VMKSQISIAARFYQLKTGHALMGKYLRRIGKRRDMKCWWCGHEYQTRDDLFKWCKRWKQEQKRLWVDGQEGEEGYECVQKVMKKPKISLPMTLVFAVLTKDLARRLTAPIGLACPHQPRLPPPVSPAPTSLACPHRLRLRQSALLAHVGLVCPHGEENGSALVLGIGLRLWQLALGFPSFTFIYKVHSFPSLCIDRQFIFFSIIFSCQQVMSPALS